MKEKEAFRIVFMGTPPFAVPSLKILHESDFTVASVVTATDKYGGRGKKKLLQSAVKKYAVKNNIPVLQPKNLKSSDFHKELASFEADLQIVVAFRMLPEKVWDMPPKGTVNLHASLLPKYRGAAPIHWAIIRGENKTGLTTFRLKQKIDTGDIIDQLEIPIESDDTMGSLAEKMSEKGAQLVISTAQKIFEGEVTYREQDLSVETPPAPKIFFEDAKIDFSNNTSEVYNFIRGMNPFPGAWTKIDGKILKIFSCEPVEIKKKSLPGTLFQANNQLRISTKDGALEVKVVQVEGKRKMETKRWLNGYTISDLKVND